MGQDIREMLRDQDPASGEKLRNGHQQRFETRLKKEYPKEKKQVRYFYWSVAAVLVVVMGTAIFFFNNPASVVTGDEVVENSDAETSAGATSDEKQFQLSEVSPEFREVENYYMASINLELARLEINDDNKALIDAFMQELKELDREYQRLNSELGESGLSEQTVEAMISNLQLRLELLLKLKNKLNEIKNSKNQRYENLQA